MRGIEFKEANTKLLPPEGKEDEVYALPVWTNGFLFISKWKLTWKERLVVPFTGAVWLHVVSGSHPPVTIESSFPFEKPPKPKWSLRRMVLFLVAGTFFFWSIITATLYFIWRSHQ
jgi:hypothetical protein